MNVKDFFVKDIDVILDCNDKNKILDLMVKTAKDKNKIKDVKAFEDAIFERENIMSTDIGWQVAIPHAKLDSIDDFFIIPAVLKQECDWQAGNDQKVKLIFMIGGPGNSQIRYLQILSKLSLIIRNESKRKALLESKTIEDVINQF